MFNIAFLDDRHMKVVRFLALLTGRLYLDWMELAQDRDRWRALTNAVMNFRIPKNTGNFLTSCKPVSFSRRTLLRGVSKYR